MFRLTPKSSLLSLALVLLLVFAVSAQIAPWLTPISAESGPMGITGDGETDPDDRAGDDPPTTEGDPDEQLESPAKNEIEIKILSWLILILNS